MLRTNVTDWTPEQLWKTYIQLTEAEAAFRIHKTELSLRPIWHQRSEREMRLRCVVRPDRSQAMLLDRLGLHLPKRLRPQLP